MANSCPICAGLGAGTGNAAGDAAKKFDDLIAALGGASTAGSALQGVLDKLAASEQAAAAAAAIAAKTGYKAADVRRAMAAQAKDQTDAAKAAQAAAGATEKVGKAAKASESSAAKATDTTSKLSGALQQQAGAATQASGAVGSLQRVLSMLGPEGQAVAVALGLIVLATTAVVAGLVKLISTAVEASQAAARLRESWGAFFGTGAAGGAKFVGDLDKIAAKLPYVGEKIREWAKPLVEARLRGAQLQRAIEAVAAANAMMGESGASAAQGLIKQFAAGARLNQAVWLSPDMLDQLAAAGVSAEVLARELGISEKRLQLSTVKASVLGDVLQRVLIRQGAGSLALVGQTWSSITAKVNEGLSAAFAGLGDLVQPFMKELQYLASELFKGSVASQGLGGILHAVLKPAFEYATKAVRDLHYALLYTEIMLLTAYIRARPLIAAIEKTGAVGVVLKGVLVSLAIVLGLVAAAAVGVAIAMVLIALPFVIAAVAVGLIIYGLYRLMAAAVAAQTTVSTAIGAMAGSVIGWLMKSAAALGAWPLEAAKAGFAFVAGLVQAITTGQGPVADAVKSLASSAVSSLLGALQIKSPSRVTAAAGGHFVAGFTGAVDEGRVEAEDAGSGLGKSATRGLVRAGGETGGKGPGRAIQFINCVFGEGLSETIVRDMIARILEAESASGPEPEPAT